MKSIHEVVAMTVPLSKQTSSRMTLLCEELARLDKENVAGDFVECGVWKGASIIAARLMSPQRTCWLYDTFAGMSQPTIEDGPHASKKFFAKPGWMSASLDEVRSTLSDADVLDDEKLVFVVGDVRETLLTNRLPEKIAILRLDVDWYEPTKVAFNVLYPRLVSGGVIIVDDYGYWDGAKRATDEFLGSGIESFSSPDNIALFGVKR